MAPDDVSEPPSTDPLIRSRYETVFHRLTSELEATESSGAPLRMAPEKPIVCNVVCPRCQGTPVRVLLTTNFVQYLSCEACRHLWCVAVAESGEIVRGDPV